VETEPDLLWCSSTPTKIRRARLDWEVALLLQLFFPPWNFLRALVLQYLQTNSEKFKVWYYTNPPWLLLNLFSVFLGKAKRHKQSYILKTWLVMIFKCLIWSLFPILWASLVAHMVKNLPAMQETRFDPWVRKILWRRERLPTPLFLLENSMDRGTWQATVHGVPKTWTRLSD